MWYWCGCALGAGVSCTRTGAQFFSVAAHDWALSRLWGDFISFNLAALAQADPQAHTANVVGAELVGAHGQYALLHTAGERDTFGRHRHGVTYYWFPASCGDDYWEQG